MTDKQYVTIGLILVGLIIIFLGVSIRLGKGRAWYFLKENHVFRPKGGYYGLPILGCAIVMMGISLLMPNQETARMIWGYVIAPLFIGFLLIVIIKPKWSKPEWVQELEERHGDILGILLYETNKLSYETNLWRELMKRISTQEGLETWITEVRHKYGLE